MCEMAVAGGAKVVGSWVNGRVKEPTVISLSLIAAAIEDEERGAFEPDADTSNYIPTAPAQATTLRLSFKS